MATELLAWTHPEPVRDRRRRLPRDAHKAGELLTRAYHASCRAEMLALGKSGRCCCYGISTQCLHISYATAYARMKFARRIGNNRRRRLSRELGMSGANLIAQPVTAYVTSPWVVLFVVRNFP